tara:strand:+ start:1802 stop:3286 length:1485 start_codon:yes stop_codon:yes gene_type:complete
MMKRPRGAVLLSLIAFLLLCNSVTADTTYDGDPALISIDIENGEYSSQSILFSGILEDDELPSDVFWRVSKDGAEFDGGDLLDSLVEITSTSSREQWSWSFELSFSATGECACYVSVHSIDDGGLEIIENRVVFMVENNSTGLIGFLLDTDQSGQLFDSSMKVSGWIGTYPFGEVNLEISGSLTQGLIQSSHIPRTSICTEASITSEVYQFSSGDFEINWDISAKLDGWLEIALIACPSSASNSVGATHEFSICVNNEPPVIKILGIDFAVEDDIWHTFDATLTEDPYWGRTDMYYVWTLRRPSHSGTLPVDVIMGEDLNTYSISGAQSGNYTLSLTVYDKGGLSSQQMVIFDIKNTIPTASLFIDGEQISDGQEFRISNPSDILLDATESSDSINDESGLRCIWLLDNFPLYEGCERSFAWLEDDDYRAELTLEVIDDDGEFATISVMLIHPDEVKPFPIALVVLAFSTLFLTYALVNRFRGNKEQSIPKWKS